MFLYFKIIYCGYVLKSFYHFCPIFCPLLPQLCQLFTTSHEILSSTTFKLIFISKIWFYSFFLIFWYAPIPPSCWMPCYMHQSFAYIFFTCFALFTSITPSHKLDVIICKFYSNTYLFDMHFIYTCNRQAHNFLTNELLQIC